MKKKKAFLFCKKTQKSACFIILNSVRGEHKYMYYSHISLWCDIIDREVKSLKPFQNGFSYIFHRSYTTDFYPKISKASEYFLWKPTKNWTLKVRHHSFSAILIRFINWHNQNKISSKKKNEKKKTWRSMAEFFCWWF